MARGRVSNNVTIHDVAEVAGVSFATVSRVINNKGYISPETRARVMRAVTQLGYVVNQQARSLAGGPSHIIGLLVREVGSTFTSSIIRGVDAEVDATGYDLMLYSHRRKKEAAFVATLTRGIAEGLLLLLPHGPSTYLDVLRQRQFPCVLIDYPNNGELFGSVNAANKAGAYRATAYLISLGHRRIGFVLGVPGMESAHDRLLGYQAALAEYGIPADPGLVVDGNYCQVGGYAAGQQLLHMPEPPTAIFASNDESAFGVIDAARDYGRRIPDDISIVGFDDTAQAAFISPALTTVRQPTEQMGRVATRMLLQCIANPDRPAESVILPTELIIRNTCQRID